LRLFSGYKGSYASWIGPDVLFILLPAIAGFIGGAQFPLANKIYLGERQGIGRVAGLTYGMDLLGSSLGAFLTAVFLIPLLGIPETCWLINFTVLVLLAISWKARLK
jgi:spermidine synthase